ncbi:integral membrane protein [Campylobacter insulaenigrae]|uniref:AtpZ/AtpI family protein n=1 Tax=Campylobacter insulaenigrae TaxID=260714 RepID=UPI000F6F1164|nr:AtpZ/AtpI family protein [Campylobacter insulaenigrae]MCR6591214.1 AtpZ/AtpI family protein [Campylobacter insulaenigrae]MCR6592652.1 AtpZ/AtpI family protein [Campylobacter insulaenigrae]VEJ53090.1 integral membrane protein [Campylobacter insulaenigrae]
MNNKKKIIRKGIEAADGLSLGISIVVAILIGVGIGFFLKKITGIFWLFWIGVFIGIGAAILNVFKAYKAQVKSYEEFKEENRYKDLRNDTKA